MQALTAEEVELADPHRQHGQVAALHLRRRRPPVELVHREEQPSLTVAQLEGVDVVLGEPERAHGDAADLDGLAVLELVDPDPAAVAHELEVRHAAEPDAEVLRDLLGQVDVGDERALRLAGPGAEVAVAGLPYAPAHRVVGVPVRVEAGGDVADAGALELELRLFRRVEEDVRPVHEGGGAGAGIWAALLTGLDADAALAAGAGDRGGTAGAEDLDPHSPNRTAGLTARGPNRESQLTKVNPQFTVVRIDPMADSCNLS